MFLEHDNDNDKKVNPYLAKSAFFDAQAVKGWAADEYGEEELKKLALLFNKTGCLSGKRILEPGCGTGRLTWILSRKVGENGKVVALDISAAMVESTRKRVAGAANTTVLLTEVENLSINSEPHFPKQKFPINQVAENPFPEVSLPGEKNFELEKFGLEKFDMEKKFDLIICHQVFPHIENKAFCLKKFNDLLMPDGKVILFHFINFEEINNVHRKAGTVVHQDMMPDDSEMELLFNGAGFKIKFIRNDKNGYFLLACRS